MVEAWTSLGVMMTLTCLSGTRDTCGTRSGPSPAPPRAQAARSRARTLSSPPLPLPLPLPFPPLRPHRCLLRPSPPSRFPPRRAHRAQTSWQRHGVAYFRCRQRPRGLNAAHPPHQRRPSLPVYGNSADLFGKRAPVARKDQACNCLSHTVSPEDHVNIISVDTVSVSYMANVLSPPWKIISLLLKNIWDGVHAPISKESSPLSHDCVI